MGDGGSITDTLKRQFVQRQMSAMTSAAASGATSTFDPLDPESIGSQQRAARSMREGLNSAFGTSTRGTDSAKGTGLQGPQDDPIIAGPTVATQPGTTAVDDAAARQAARDAAADARDKYGPPQPRNGGPRTYRF